jgi:hypothetical protein
LDQATHNKIVSFIWGIADDVLRDLEDGKSNLTFKCVLFGVLVFIGGMWSLLLGQDVNYDLLNYHLYNPYAFFHNRMGWDLAPAGIQTFYNPLGDVPYYFLSSVFAHFPRLVAFFMGAYFGIGAFFLYLISLELFSEYSYRHAYASLATIVGVTGAAGVAQLGTTFNEWQTAALCLPGVFLTLKSLRTRSNFWSVFAAGVLIGIAVGFKLTAAPFAIGVAAAIASTGGRLLERARLLAAFGVGGTGGFAMAGLPWCLMLYSKFQNPIFPYFNSLFRSEWAPPISIIDPRFFPQNVAEWIFYPFYWALAPAARVSEPPLRDPRFAVVFLIGFAFIGVALARQWKRGQIQHPQWRFIAVLFFITYIVWLVQFSIYRYVISLEAISGVIIVGAAYHVTERPAARVVLAAILSLTVVLLTSAPNWGRIRFGDRVASVDAPELPAGSLVMVAEHGHAPISFIIPYLRNDARFVKRYMSAEYRFGKVVDDAVKNHQGPMFTLEYSADDPPLNKSLEHFGLFRVASKCAAVKSNLTSSGMQVCPLQRRGR